MTLFYATCGKHLRYVLYVFIVGFQFSLLSDLNNVVRYADFEQIDNQKTFFLSVIFDLTTIRPVDIRPNGIYSLNTIRDNNLVQVHRHRTWIGLNLSFWSAHRFLLYCVYLDFSYYI